MLALMEDALKEGACGLSLGLMYEPGIYAGMEELKDVARLCEKYDRPRWRLSIFLPISNNHTTETNYGFIWK